MTQDEIIEMARQAGIYHAQDSEYHWDGLTDQKIIERTPDSAKDIAWRNRRTFEILKPFAKLVAEKALAQPEQEPSYYGLTVDHLWMCISKDDYDRLKPEYRMACYASLPQRKPLSAEQVSEICAEWTDENGNTGSFGRRQIARAIEAAHGIKE